MTTGYFFDKVPQGTSNSDGPPQTSPIWERLYNLFSRRSVDSRVDDQPKRRGVVVTMSILVSSLLWFTFTMRETHTKIIRMPTEVVNVPEGESLRQLPPEDVRVQAMGDGWSLLRLRLNPPTIPLDAAMEDINVREEIPDLPKNVEVQSVSPTSLKLWKERRITRKVPIVSRVQIDTPPTHDLIDEEQLFPDSVEVSGAASVVGDLTRWPTAERTFENVRDTLDLRVPLSDTLSGLVTKSVDDVRIRAVSEQFTEGSREIDVTVQGQPSTRTLVSLEPSTVNVRYRVLFSQYREAMRAMDFFATVSYDSIRSDTTGRVRPHLNLPEGIVLKDVTMRPEELGYYERID